MKAIMTGMGRVLVAALKNGGAISSLSLYSRFCLLMV